MLAILGLGLVLGRNRWIAPFVLARLQPLIEAQLGGPLEVESFEGDWIGSLTLTNVRFHRTAETGPLVELNARKVHLSYRPLDLLRGDLAGLECVDLDLHSLTLEPDSPLPHADAQPEEAQAAALTLSAQLPTVTVRIERFGLRLDGNTLALEDFALETEGEQLRLNVAHIDPQAVLPNAPGGAFALVARLRDNSLELVEARFARVLRAGPGSLDLSSWLETERGMQSPRPADSAATQPLLTLDELTLEEGANRLALTGLVLPSPTEGIDALLESARGEFECTVGDLPGLMALFGGSGARPSPSRDLPEHRIELRGALSDRRLVLEAGSAVASAGHLQLERGTIRFARDPHRTGNWWRQANLDVDLSVDFPDLAGVGRLLDRPALGGSLGGRLRLGGVGAEPQLHLETRAREVSEGEMQLRGLNLTADLAGALEALDGEFKLAVEDAVWGEESLHSLDLAGTLREGVLALDRLRVTWRDYRMSGTLGALWDRVSGDISIELSGLNVERGGQGLRLLDRARIGRRRGTWTLTNCAFGAPQGSLVATGSFPESDQGDEMSTLGLVFENFSPGALAEPFFPPGFDLSSLQGRVNVSWHGAAPNLWESVTAELRLFAPALVLDSGAPALAVELDLSLTTGTLEVGGLALTAPRLGRLTLEGSLPRDTWGMTNSADDALDLRLTVETEDIAAWPESLRRSLFGQRLALAGGLRIDGKLDGSLSAVRGTLRAQGSELTVADRISGQTLEAVQLDLELELGDTLRIPRCVIDLGQRAELKLEAELDAVLDLTALARGQIDSLLDAEVQARMSSQATDLSWLANEFEAVRRLDGTFSGELSLDGNLGAPRLEGSLALSQVDLRLTNAFPALQEVELDLSLRDNTLELGNANGLLGGAHFGLAGSVEDLFTTPRLDFHLRGEDLLLLRQENMRLRADTDILVQGPLEALVAKGVLKLADGRYGGAIALLSGLSGQAKPPSAGRGLDLSLATEGPIAAMRFDLELRAREPFRVATNLVKGGLRPRLHLGGTGRVPLLDGSVFLEPTFVSLPSGILRVEAGRVLFDPQDPFVPKLELNGNMRLRGYDLVAQITGDYDDPLLRLSSTPPLPNQDLLVLFLTGQLPEGSAASRNRAAAQSVAVYLAKDYITRWLSGPSDSDSDSVLTRIELTVGNDVTRSGALSAEVTYLLTGRSQGPGQERYLIGERDVYDKINFGYGWRFRFR